MNCFMEITEAELTENVNGGGLLSCIAGGIAGAIVGAYVGIVPAVITGDGDYLAQSVITGTSVGIWAGAGCPLP